MQLEERSSNHILSRGRWLLNSLLTLLDWSFRLLHRSRTELLLLPRTRRLLTEERRRHWKTSLLDRTKAVVVHRRWWTRETILWSKSSHGQGVTNAMVLVKILPLEGHVSKIYLHLQLPLP